MIIEFIKILVTLLIGIIAVFLCFGFVLGRIGRATTNKLVRRFGSRSIIVTGIVGTTIHEFSHLIVAKLFLHKINEVKFFSWRLESEQLGYVKHSFNKKSYYQRVGNFFIGIAPIILGTGIIILLFRLLLGDSFSGIMKGFNFSEYVSLSNNFHLGTFISLLYKDSILIITSIFTMKNILSLNFWIFLFLSISISTHMDLSTADFKGAFDGVIFIAIIALLASVLCLIIGITFNQILYFIIIYNIFIIAFLIFGLIFSVIGYLISLLITL